MNTQNTTQNESSARTERLAILEKNGINPYPSKTKRTHSCAQALKIGVGKKVIISGRIKTIRSHGASTFVDLEDESGKIQVYLKLDEIGSKNYELFKSTIDMGDFLNVGGSLFKTKRGEKTVLAKKWIVISKSIKPLPEKWHGLQDIEIRFRKKYLDLISNPEVREIFKKRAKTIQGIREFLDKNGYLEVETPMLQPLPGGALAKPFVTHHNALDNDFYLRIAPELYLKRLIIGGYEKVYELGKQFRNEGIDWSHNPEFTSLEFYQAYMDYKEMMDFTEDLIISIIKKVLGKPEIEYQGKTIKFKKHFKKITFRKSIMDSCGVDIEAYPDQKSIYKKAKEMGLKDVSPKDGRGKICDEFYKEFFRKNTIQPTFVIDHPIELSPLAKKKEDDPRYVERFQIVCGGGLEIVNAFSELNDPCDQRERFNAQQEAAIAGDDEAHPIDEDFIEAMEHGMPPTAGFGMGIDRFLCLLCDKRNIKEVILFPTLKPKEKIK